MNKRAQNLADTVHPVHVHDCDCCIFTGQRVVNAFVTYDFYYCENSLGGPSIIARWDADGDYYSCKVSHMATRPRDPDYPLDWAYACFVAAGW